MLHSTKIDLNKFYQEFIIELLSFWQPIISVNSYNLY